MRVPISLNQITISQYQEAYPIWQSISKEKDAEKVLTKWANVIAILADCQTDEVEALPISRLKTYIQRLSALLNSEPKSKVKRFVILKGKLYRASLNELELSPGQYIDILTFLEREGIVPAMHKILASIYSPLTIKGFRQNARYHSEHAAKFRQASFGKLYPTVFFYSKRSNNLIKTIQDYGISQAEKQMRKAQKLLDQTLKESLESIGAGT